MKAEQRLLLALGMTLGIMVFWTTLFPPPKEFPTGLAGHPKSISLSSPYESQTQESAQEFLLKPFSFHVGKSGGIQTLLVEGIPLLKETSPGLLQIRDPSLPEQTLPFETSEKGGILSSRTRLGRDGVTVLREISLGAGEHKFLLNMTLEMRNESQEKRRQRIEVLVYRPLYTKEQEERRYQDGFVFVEGKSHRLRPHNAKSMSFHGSPEWITAQGKSHLLILKPEQPIGLFHVEQSLQGAPLGWLELPSVELPPGGSFEWKFLLYAGPMAIPELRAAGLDETISFGAFSGIARILLDLLTWSENRLHNYGLAIVFVSFGIWLLFFPLTWSGIRMMKVMGKLQPQIERLKEEHKKNPKKLNQEVLELYKKHRVNPLSGCLPLFLQMPIFIALYQVLSRSPQLRGARFLWIRDLAGPDALVRFSQPVPLLGENLNLLPILMSIGMFVQQKMSRVNQVALTEEQQIQQKVFQWFPLLFGFLFYRLPSGLVLYWVCNTILTLGQQLIYSQTREK